MARATLTTKADEGSTYVVRATYYDDTGASVTPNEAEWTLTDGDGVVVNSRVDVSIVVPSTYNDIVLGPDDLRCKGERDETRILMLRYEYDSTTGSDLVGRAQVSFLIHNLQGISYSGGST